MQKKQRIRDKHIEDLSAKKQQMEAEMDQLRLEITHSKRLGALQMYDNASNQGRKTLIELD